MHCNKMIIDFITKPFKFQINYVTLIIKSLQLINTFFKFGPIASFYFIKKYIQLKLFNNSKCLLESNGNNLNYILSYEYYGMQYKMLLKKKERRPRNEILLVTDELNNDVTDEIKKWMGPYYDFHGIDISPHAIGFNILYFVKNNKDILKFEFDEKIDLLNKPYQTLDFELERI